ncbi:MAG: hypothetical protein J6B63_02690 [Treponema sp.]|nr:hypothetical protein [Treponema sp.]
MRHFEFFKVPFSVLGDTIGVPEEFKFRAELKNDAITDMIGFEFTIFPFGVIL